MRLGNAGILDPSWARRLSFDYIMGIPALAALLDPILERV